VAAPGFDKLSVRKGSRVTLSKAKEPSPEAWPLRSAQGDSSAYAVRTALIPASPVDVLDPTGCGDVFGAAACARLLAGDRIEGALRHATAMATRNAALRGAGGLSRHLRGELLVP